MTYIEEMRDVIRRLHGADAEHVGSVPVKEMFRGRTVWDGVVEVFDLYGHPTASKLYAWTHDTDDPKTPRRHVTVLHSPLSLLQRQRLGPQSFRSLEALSQPKAKKAGRPKMAKGHAKARIVPVRFASDSMKQIAAAAKASNQTVSEWIRSTLDAQPDKAETKLGQLPERAYRQCRNL